MQRGKCSKTQHAHEVHEIAFVAIFSHGFFAECFTVKRKTDSISTFIRRMTTAETARAVGLLQQYVSSTLPVCLGPRLWNADVRNDWLPENDELSLVCRELRHLSVGDICSVLRKKWLTCRIPAPCRGIPTALALFSVVIRRMMMVMLSVFLLRETCSK